MNNNDTATPNVTYPSTTALIASTASTVASMLDITAEEAVDRFARTMVENAHDARTRGGRWAQESTTQQIEDAMFQGAVAADVLDGTVSRPSIGNVRAHTLALIEA